MGKVIHIDSSSGGASGTGWQGEVEFRADLPISLGSPAIGDVYLVQKPTTILFGAYKTYQSGLYIRDFNNGNLNDWRRLNVKVKFTDSEFAIVSAIDESKQAKFDLSLLTTSTTRTYTYQDKDYIIAGLDDVEAVGRLARNNSSTGVVFFEGLFINADPTKFDRGEVKGWFKDDTDPVNPVVTYKEFPRVNGITTTNIGVSPFSFIGININGVTIQQSVQLSLAQTRSISQLGVLNHPTLTTITALVNSPALMSNIEHQMMDFAVGIGQFNLKGNVFRNGTTSLRISKSIGSFYFLNSNYTNNVNDPSTIASPDLVDATFQYRNSTTLFAGPDTQLITPNVYESPLGTNAVVPNNKWTIQRIFLSISGTVRVQYGQRTYANKAEALQGLDADSYTPNPNIATTGILRGFLLIKESTVDFTDPTKFQFVEAPKFGFGGGSSGGTSVSSLQQAYDNSITDPEILLNAVNDSVDFQLGDAGVVNFLRGKNVGGGVVLWLIDKLGQLNIQSIQLLAGVIKNSVGTKRIEVGTIGVDLFGEVDLEDYTTEAAGRILELSPLKRILSIVKATAYNKNFGTAAGTVAEGLKALQLVNGTVYTDETGNVSLGSPRTPNASRSVFVIATVEIDVSDGQTSSIDLTVGAIVVGTAGNDINVTGLGVTGTSIIQQTLTAIIPPNTSYQLDNSGSGDESIIKVTELIM